MNTRITALLAAACLLSACDGSDIKVTIETHSSSSEAQSSVQSSSSVVSSVVASSSNSQSNTSSMWTTSSHGQESSSATSGSTLPTEEEIASKLALIRTNRESWESNAPVKYQFDIQETSTTVTLYSRTTRVFVANGEISSSEVIDEFGHQLISPSPRILSIKALFDSAEKILLEGGNTSITYEETLGYPINAILDPQPNAVDDNIAYSITNFTVTHNNSSSSSEPRTLSEAEKAARIAERDKASATWSNHQDRSYQYQLGDYGNCIVGFYNCNGVYDYTFTTFGVVDSGEAILGFGKSISDEFGYLFKGGHTLDSRANLSDSFVTNPTYSISYSKEGIASWSYSYPDRFDDDYGRDELLSLEFFDDLETTRQTQKTSWQANKPDSEYSYTLTVDCDCYYDGSHRVVISDTGISAAPLSATYPMPRDTLTIESLYDLLATAYNEPSAYVSVIYNEEYHFPESITFNPSLPRSDANITYTISELSDRFSLNEASKALAQWRKASDGYFEYRFESKEFSTNLYHYLMSALGRTHQIQTALNESETPPIAANIEEVYQTIFKYSDARDIEFQADTHGVPTEVRIHPADRAPGDYLQYLISNFQWLTSTDSGTVAGIQRLWEVEAISHYIMTVDVSCFCLVTGPVEVEVQDGTIIRAYAERLERELTEQERSWRIYTIEGLFEDIKATLTQDRTAEVLFNSEHYYPQLVVIDRQGQAADAGYNLEITDFKPLN